MEEAGKAQIGDDDHHAEQQCNGIEVDGAIGLLEAERAARHHQTGAHQCRPGAVEPEPRQAADGDDHIGGGEDEEGEHGFPGRPWHAAPTPTTTGVRPPRHSTEKKP
jgi:hypothetical protein